MYLEASVLQCGLIMLSSKVRFVLINVHEELLPVIHASGIISCLLTVIVF